MSAYVTDFSSISLGCEWGDLISSSWIPYFWIWLLQGHTFFSSILLNLLLNIFMSKMEQLLYVCLICLQVVPLLRKQFRNVVVADFLGFGFSDKPVSDYGICFSFTYSCINMYKTHSVCPLWFGTFLYQSGHNLWHILDYVDSQSDIIKGGEAQN